MKKKVLGMKKIVLRMKKIVPFIYYLFNATEQESIATKLNVKFFKRKWKKITLEVKSNRQFLYKQNPI